METPSSNTTTTKEFDVTGVSRSGRVRKKSSKLIDFQSDDVEKKPKRNAHQPSGRGTGQRGRPPLARTRRALEQFDAVQQNVAAAAAAGRKISTDDEDDDDDDDQDEHDESFDDVHLMGTSGVGLFTSSSAGGGVGVGGIAADSDFDEMVADFVGHAEAESLRNTNNNMFESKVRQSLYMTEKSNKRKMLKDGKVITGKVERKDKGKSRYTAYNMWAREFRKTSKFSKNQDLDFSNAARRLGELWANVSNKDKSAWRRKAKIQATKAKARDKAGMEMIHSNNNNNNNNNIINSSNIINNINTTPSSSATSSGSTLPEYSTTSNTIFTNRATTQRTRKLAAGREKINTTTITPTPTALTTTTTKQTSKPDRSGAMTMPKQTKRYSTYRTNNTNNEQLYGTKARTSSRTVNDNDVVDDDDDIDGDDDDDANNNDDGGNNNNVNLVDNVYVMPTTTTKKQNYNTVSIKGGSIKSQQNDRPKIDIIDTASHLKLLGESLGIIGERLKEHDGQIAISGSLSVLLDSLLCSMGPLLCLTKRIPGLENCTQLVDNLSGTLDNIAYIMPGV